MTHPETREVTMSTRRLTPVDHLLVSLDQGLRTVFGRPVTTDRPYPAEVVDEADMAPEARRQAAGLMRVNHAGEVAAQGLYQGQAVTARLPQVRESMERAAAEENDHLDWCERRVHELDSHVSRLGPFWYAGSFLIGALAGAAGDRWSLGFVAETERQVVVHLDRHLDRLPLEDGRSRAIVSQMREDELEHATTAVEAGGAPLPAPVRGLMGLASRVMTTLAYRV
jgi:ubiquinone biosynthesis monooxygenase Coq7